MSLFSKEIPEHLYGKRYLATSFVVTIITSIVLALLYLSYSASSPFRTEDADGILDITGFIIVSCIYIASNKVLFRASCLKRKRINAYGLAAILAETLVTTLLFFCFRCTASEKMSTDNLAELVLRSYSCILLILGTSYLVAALIDTVKQQQEQLSRKNRSETSISSPRAEEKSLSEWNSRILSLYDNKNKLILQIKAYNLLYVSSMDNYVRIIYDSEEEARPITKTLRCTTRSVEESFGDHVVRCHRSYLVNPARIVKFNNEHDNTYLVLNNPDINTIPVSRSWKDDMIRLTENIS